MSRSVRILALGAVLGWGAGCSVAFSLDGYDTGSNASGTGGATQGGGGAPGGSGGAAGGGAGGTTAGGGGASGAGQGGGGAPGGSGGDGGVGGTSNGGGGAPPGGGGTVSGGGGAPPGGGGVGGGEGGTGGVIVGCGNGIAEGTEECDDGGAIGGPCDGQCKMACWLVNAEEHIVNGRVHCYRAYNDNVSWEAARDACAQGSAVRHLVTITDAEENAFVANLAGSQASIVWIGGTDGQPVSEWTQGNYGWDTGEQTTFINWDAGEPDWDMVPCGVSMCWEHRVAMGTLDGEWSDLLASDDHPYVCESEPPGFPFP